MNHATVTTAFYVSLLVILPIGLLLMILWMRKIFKPLSKSIEESGRVNLDMINQDFDLFASGSAGADSIFNSRDLF